MILGQVQSGTTCMQSCRLFFSLFLPHHLEPHFFFLDSMADSELTLYYFDLHRGFDRSHRYENVHESAHQVGLHPP
jgi:hypothetical protein